MVPDLNSSAKKPIVNAGTKNNNNQGAIKNIPSSPAYPESSKLNDPGKTQRNNPLIVENIKITIKPESDPR
jgi:hypothetical protein